MKKVILFATAAIMAFSAWADQEYHLVVKGADGTQQKFNINELDHISFDGDKMLVHKDGVATEFAIDDIDHMTLDLIEGIEATFEKNFEGLQLAIDHGVLTAAQPGTQLNMQIFDLNGRLVAATAADSELTYSLIDLPAGAYIVTVNGKAVKFIR